MGSVIGRWFEAGVFVFPEQMVGESVHDPGVNDRLRESIDEPGESWVEVVDAGEYALAVEDFAKFEAAVFLVGGEQAACDPEELSSGVAGIRVEGEFQQRPGEQSDEKTDLLIRIDIDVHKRLEEAGQPFGVFAGNPLGRAAGGDRQSLNRAGGTGTLLCRGSDQFVPRRNCQRRRGVGGRCAGGVLLCMMVERLRDDVSGGSFCRQAFTPGVVAIVGPKCIERGVNVGSVDTAQSREPPTDRASKFEPRLHKPARRFTSCAHFIEQGSQVDGVRPEYVVVAVRTRHGVDQSDNLVDEVVGIDHRGRIRGPVREKQNRKPVERATERGEHCSGGTENQGGAHDGEPTVDIVEHGSQLVRRQCRIIEGSVLDADDMGDVRMSSGPCDVVGAIQFFVEGSPLREIRRGSAGRFSKGA